MSEPKRSAPNPFGRTTRQRGHSAVEFALIAVAFFTIVFGVIELARLMFLFNTLPEVTSRAARAAANTDFSKPMDMDKVRWHAIFRDTAGALSLMSELTDESVRVDYMAITRNSDGTLGVVPIPTASLPANPSDNRKICLVDPNSSACIRIVRVRVCDRGTLDTCEPMQFRPLVPLINITLPLPTSLTLARAQSLGL